MIWWEQFNFDSVPMMKDGDEFTRWVLKPERVRVHRTDNGYFLEVLEDEKEKE